MPRISQLLTSCFRNPSSSSQPPTRQEVTRSNQTSSLPSANAEVARETIVANPRAQVKFNPRRIYSTEELLRFVSSGALTDMVDNEKLSLLGEMSFRIMQQDTTTRDKGALAQYISKSLPADETIFHAGGERQGNFFSSMAVDYLFDSLQRTYDANTVAEVQDTIKRWVETQVPAQTEFNIRGVIFTRDEMLNMVNASTLFQPSEAIVQVQRIGLQMDEEMRSVTGAQNVHREPVKAVNQIIKNRMLARCAEPRLQSSVDLLKSQITRQLIASTEMSDVFNRGLNQLFSHGFSPGERLCDAKNPTQMLGLLWTYIKNTPNAELRRNLRLALLERIIEVGVEQPCYTGQVQRLLDVPSGIDPDLGVLDLQAMVEHEVDSVAARVKVDADSLEAEVRAFAAQTGEVFDEQQLKEITKSMFQQKVDLLLGRTRGLDKAILEQRTTRNLPAFDY